MLLARYSGHLFTISDALRNLRRLHPQIILNDDLLDEYDAEQALALQMEREQEAQRRENSGEDWISSILRTPGIPEGFEVPDVPDIEDDLDTEADEMEAA